MDDTSSPNELENLNQNIHLSGDSRLKSELLNRKEKESIKLIEETGGTFTDLSNHSILDQATKIRAERLKNDFKRSLQRFQRIQSDIKRRLAVESHRLEPPVADLLGLENSGQGQTTTADDNLLFQTGSQLQIQQPGQVDAQELGYVLQQEEQMQAIEEDIMNVNTIFQQLSTLVYDQREAVESLEDNVQEAYVNVEGGVEHLQKAATSRQRSRKRCCICTIVLVVALSVTILVLILIYGPNSKN